MERVQEQARALESGLRRARECVEQYAALKGGLDESKGMGSRGGLGATGVGEALKMYDQWRESFGGRVERSNGTDRAIDAYESGR
eukprot:2581943-Rhodomonas_salina.4